MSRLDKSIRAAVVNVCSDLVCGSLAVLVVSVEAGVLLRLFRLLELVKKIVKVYHRF